MSEYLIGLDLGGSSVKWVAATSAGEVLRKGVAKFDAEKRMDFAAAMRACVAKIRTDLGETLMGIGLSAPGLAAKDGRSIAFMPGRLEGLEDLVWGKFLGDQFDIPVLNDAHSALLGEAWIGAAKNSSNVIMLTLGTGVGGAAMVDGNLLLGNIGRAGHLGHVTLDPDGPADVTGMPGALEVAIGNCSIEKRTNGRFKTTHDLIAAHQQGDPAASAIWLKSVRDLAFAIGGFINILDPEVVIIGGGIARAGNLLFDPLEKYLRPIEWQAGGHSVPIKPAQLGEFAGAIGAAKNALRSAQK
jgi:glucokinase